MAALRIDQPNDCPLFRPDALSQGCFKSATD